MNTNLTTTAPAVDLPTQTFAAFAVFAVCGLLVSIFIFQRYGTFKRNSLYVIIAGK